jgi:uncharacterized iron-regulated membrane protein
MRRLALHGTLRQWLARLHRWSGLVVMLLLCIASTTGVWLVFRQELDRALNARLRVVEPAATRLPGDEIVALVERQFPGAMVSLVQLPQRPDEAMSLSLTAKASVRRRFDAVYVNQYTGEILGQRDRRHGLTRASLDSLILGLHFTLMAGEWGRRLMGVAAVVWLITNLVGLALSWPRLWLRLASWLPILSVRTTRGAYKTNYGLHRATGVWLLPALTVLAFTSVALNLPEYVRPAVLAFSQLSRQPSGTRVAPEDAVVMFDQANAAVQRAFPEARTNNIYRDLSNGWYSVYFHLPEDVNPQGDNFALVDLRTGAITAVRRPARGTGGDRFMAWLYPLHTGGAFGWTGRTIVALSGVAMVIMSGTGLYVWWVKWRMRRRAGVAARLSRLLTIESRPA